jgi:hypothetical protein
MDMPDMIDNDMTDEEGSRISFELSATASLHPRPPHNTVRGDKITDQSTNPEEGQMPK